MLIYGKRNSMPGRQTTLNLIRTRPLTRVRSKLAPRFLLIQLKACDSIGISLSAVKKRFAEQEYRESQAGTGFIFHESISASQLISIGLDLEIEQCIFILIKSFPTC